MGVFLLTKGTGNALIANLREVRVWGDTAVVTAKLWERGTDGGKPFDYTAWFSDIYVRTQGGWRYRFAQSSLPLPGGHK